MQKSDCPLPFFLRSDTVNPLLLAICNQIGESKVDIVFTPSLSSESEPDISALPKAVFDKTSCQIKDATTGDTFDTAHKWVLDVRSKYGEHGHVSSKAYLMVRNKRMREWESEIGIETKKLRVSILDDLFDVS
jgi:hypothetical protein